jgi:predicted AlkP superfamily pyrophosphatase or phosphodiesterase
MGDAQHAVIILIDGLGWNSLITHRDLAPCLTSDRHLATEISTVFPSTTPAGLGTLGTGLLPGAHGLVGASFWLPEAEEILTPLHWNDGVTPLAVQPERTIFEHAHRLVRSSTRTLTYVYWPDLDRTGHAKGVGSREWQSDLRQVDRLVEQISQSLPSNAVAIVTADHGMVNCDERVSIDDDPVLSAGIVRIAGEPRMRHVYVREGLVSEVAEAWRQRLEGRVDIRTREELIGSGLLGEVEFDIAERIGDFVAISRGTTALSSSFDTRVSALIGQHGALTDDEMRIPAIVMRGSGN